MGDNSLITRRQLQTDLERFYNDKIYNYLNGATHTGCVPLGTILPYFGETAPTHFLICDGTEYAKADYPELAEHLLALTDPSPYVVSGDNTKFKVPDLRGEFLRGSGTNSHTNQGNGANVGVHQDGTVIPSIGTTPDSKVMVTRFPVSSNIDRVNADSQPIKGTKYGEISVSTTTYDSATAGYTSRPTNTSVTYIIAYRNAYIDLALDSFPINITQPTDGQLLMYDATAGRWVNGGHKYSTDEHVVGKWIDGRNVYEKTINNITVVVGSLQNIPHNVSNFGFVVNCRGFHSDGYLMVPNSTGASPTKYTCCIDSISSTNIVTYCGENRGGTINLIIDYVKTTD